MIIVQITEYDLNADSNELRDDNVGDAEINSIVNSTLSEPQDIIQGMPYSNIAVYRSYSPSSASSNDDNDPEIMEVDE